MREQAGHYSGKRIVGAGGAQFVGAHLTQSLLDEGAEVIVADNFQTGQERKLISHGRLSVLWKDVVVPVQIDGEVSQNRRLPPANGNRIEN